MSDLPRTKGRLPARVLGELDGLLAPVDAALRAAYPGDRLERQPVHTVYVPADRFNADLVARWGGEAIRLVEEHLADAADRAAVVASPAGTDLIWDRVLAKLRTQPIEDLRIDFEDGYGPHSDAEEDDAAVRAGRELAASVAAGTAPPFTGIRFRSLEAATRHRGVRTIDLFLAGLLDSGPVPTGFVLTLPKVTSPAQVEGLAQVCAALEDAYGLGQGTLRFELQIEVPAAVLGADGAATVARLLRSGDGRVSALHFGTYDYSAACGIAAPYQSLEHAVADHAKAVMQVATAGTGVWLADGSTNVIPVGDRAAVRDAWRLHARLVRRSLERGFYQGWDLHPGHLPTRFAATYAFFADSFEASAARLRAYRDRQEAGILDEPATAQALAAFLLRGLDCGALDPAETVQACGASVVDLRSYAGRRIG